MKVSRYSITGLSLSVLLSACAAVQGGGDVDRGRQDLLAGNNKAALGYFQQAEQADPTYMYGTELREGVSSFLGRTQYLTGDYPQARQTLQKALLSTGAITSHGSTLVLRCIVSGTKRRR